MAHSHDLSRWKRASSKGHFSHRYCSMYSSTIWQQPSTQVMSDIEIPECLLFADDILLQCETERRMLALLDITENWCDANHMTINVLKSGTTHKGMIFSIKGEKIPQVETYRYLGIPISSTGIEPKGLIEENIRRATGVLALVKKSLASRLWPPAIKINIYKLYIRSVMEYSAPILILLDQARSQQEGHSSRHQGDAKNPRRLCQMGTSQKKATCNARVHGWTNKHTAKVRRAHSSIQTTSDERLDGKPHSILDRKRPRKRHHKYGCDLPHPSRQKSRNHTRQI